MQERLKKLVMATAALAAVAVGSAVIANASSNGSGAQSATTAQTQSTDPYAAAADPYAAAADPYAAATAAVPAAQQGTTGQQGTDPGRGGPPPGGHGPGEKLLSGDTAAKVKSAAEDKVPGGTVLRVETDSDGSPYEAHVRKSDGTEVVVKVDKDFKATDVEEHGPHGKTP
jgi:hypothetical protein